MSSGAWWNGRSVLVVTAAPAEARAVASGLGCAAPETDGVVECGRGWRLVRTGVGKVNAAVGVTRALRDLNEAADGPVVLNLGVCGALPSERGALPIRSVVMADASVYADEGVITPGGFIDMRAVGFPPFDGRSGETCSAVETDPVVREGCLGVLRARLGEVRVGRIATVSTCSGTDASSREIAARTGAIAEAMEGAAIAHALGPVAGRVTGFVEIRVVSNTTGDRAGQVWDLAGALETLSRVAGALRSAPGAGLGG